MSSLCVVPAPWEGGAKSAKSANNAKRAERGKREVVITGWCFRFGGESTGESGDFAFELWQAFAWYGKIFGSIFRGEKRKYNCRPAELSWRR